MGCGKRPEALENAPELLVIGVDGGRVQMREKNAETGSRWREDKVVTVTSYIRGDGGEKAPVALVSTHIATMKRSEGFGRLARLEASRRNLGKAQEVVMIADCGNWIEPLREREFGNIERIADWYHVKERLYECACAVYPDDAAQAKGLAEKWVKATWEGGAETVAAEIRAYSEKAGLPRKDDVPEHPRRVLSQSSGYFEKNKGCMKYPEYRRRGLPVGSGVTEAGVKQMNKRVKGTEQCWNEDGVEAILSLRGLWISQDGRWRRYWAWRPAYMDCSVNVFKAA